MKRQFPVKTMEDLEKLGHRMKWQWFERLVGWVFGQNDFNVSIGIVKKNSRFKRQYDVIAEGPRHVFAVDCKRWSGNRYKASQVRKAADRQIERSLFLRKDTDKVIIPLIVTLMKEDVTVHSGVPVVPVEMLNAFLNSWEERVDEIRRI